MSQSSDEDNFDAYRDDIKSMKSNDRDTVNDHKGKKKLRPKHVHDYNARLKTLNKALRGKLKELNDRLERVLERIYVK